MSYETISTGQLITTAKLQEFQNAVINVFASASARDSAITSATEGMFAYLSDTNTLTYYNGSSWAEYVGEGDISSVVAGLGLDGGGASGIVTLNLDANELTAVTATTTDYVVIEDVTDNTTKKALVSDLQSTVINFSVKVADDGSGSQNVYYFLSGSDSGAGTKSVDLDLSSGFTYKFDISDSSMSGHPLQFSTTADGSHNSGSEFTTNVTKSGTGGSTGDYIQIEITPETLGTAGATKTLYYYCPNHSGMGGAGQLSLLPRTDYADIGLVIALG